MNHQNFKFIIPALVLMVSLGMLQGCGQSTSPSSNSTENIDSLKKIVLQLAASNDSIANHLKKFDELDFDVFSNQKWDRLKESHAPDIKVFWPDGHMAQGIDVHIEDLKKLFVHAPDTRIKEHPIKFGSGNYTLVTGVFEGTFTKPMPIGNGKFIPPTGKAFKMPMATVGIWENGVMKEEHLFWDNQTYAKQIGLQ
ncbi:ester cyclase [Chitinophaga sp. CF418]|uniref:ester cyclase n=1 Tax=Chitinophaga sp. CF418 TaxID=1855287 RepID=UPI000916A83C|nr:ester cyclase [Chitinophaga sp. CF418]SHN33196.1 SnoaL-like polyketide cyclase [Chitinophaga sp. CF418]